METAKEKLLAAKSRCQQAILDAIIEFEEFTGLDVNGVEYHKRSVPVSFGAGVCSKEVLTEKWVTIAISL